MARAVTFQKDKADPSAYIARGAIVFGDVTLGAHSSVWFNAVIRGDTESIVIGVGCNIQDGAILHADPGFPCVLGDGCSVGHAAIVHGATLGAGVLVGMRAVVMNGAQVGDHCIIGAGALITEGTVIPPGKLVVGMPGRVLRDVGDVEKQLIELTSLHYREAIEEYRAAET